MSTTTTPPIGPSPEPGDPTSGPQPVAPRPHPAAPRTIGPWVGVPTWRDPRLPFATLLLLYVGLGSFVWGFNRSPWQVLAILASGCALDMALHWILRERKLLFPLSAIISCSSLAILLNFSHDSFLLVVPVFFTIGSKYLVTIDGKHHFNPSLFGITLSLLLTGSLITAAPSYQWGAWWYTSPFIVAAAVMLFLFKVNRAWLVFSFLFFYTLQLSLRAWIIRFHVPPEALFVGTLTQPPFFLFAFFMITDPKTSPNTRRGQILIALAIVLVDLCFHLVQSVFTFFYAAFTVATARFVWAHVQRIRAAGGLRPRLRIAWSRQWVATAATLGVMAVAGTTVYATVIHPRVAITDAGFRLEEVPSSTTGITAHLDGSTYKLVDPRIRNVAKWMLSVGSSVNVADVDGDGLQDVFLSNSLARPESRTALYRNMGNFHFQRVPMPLLDDLDHNPKIEGIASGALWFDYDQDGQQDLLVLVSFGHTRLLHNVTREHGGKITFEDVSKQSGVWRYTISIAANAIDYDRDGDPDVLIGEILPTHLQAYPDPKPRFSIFDLPAAEHKGDRRMYRFMHASWDNATNGGRNIMLTNDGHGHFTTRDMKAFGMPETKYSLAIATGDLNGDGWTDIYSASDFGRDDFYINEGGRHFRRIQGGFYGQVGKDTYKGMNATIADLDRNGWQDVYVSNDHHALQAEGSLLWMNQGMNHGTSEADPPKSAKQWPAPKLQDQATGRGALNEDRFGWGGDAGDLNLDGWQELVQANGMVSDKLDNKYKGCPDYWYVNHKMMQSGPEIHEYADMWGDLTGRCIFPNEKRRIYLNRGDHRPEFVDVAKLVGLTRGGDSRATGLVDLDNDGRLDLVIASQDSQAEVYHNTVTKAGRGNQWLGVRLVGNGTTCSRDAIGSTVRISLPGQKVQLREVQSVDGLSSQHDMRMVFGFGHHHLPAVGVPVSVRWCGRETERMTLEPGDYHTVTQAG